MTADKFRRTALAVKGAEESSHMKHPDFRLGGKIFATLGYPDEDHAMVKLTPVQQRTFRKKAPDVFVPCAGKWGKRGATSVYLQEADEGLVQTAIASAVKNLSFAAKDQAT